MIKYSISNKTQGSHKNSYKVDDTTYCFGKGTSYNYIVKNVNSIAEAIPDLLYCAVSPYIYKEGHRHTKNLAGVGNLVLLDIDSAQDIEAEILNVSARIPFQHAIVPTQNHLTINAKKNALMYKYRLVVPCEGISNIQEYKAVVHWLISAYSIPHVDSASWTDARFFAPTLPIVGQKYKSYINNDEKPYVVTQEEVHNFLVRLKMYDSNGNLALLPEHYPSNFTGQILQYHPNMGQYAPIEDTEEVTEKLTGRELTVPFSDISNTLSEDAFKRVEKGTKIPIGEIARALRADERVFCECPTKHLHTDPTDERYAWLLKTGAGGVRLYCSSDHCTKKYGSYRQIVLPDWRDFIGDRNFDTTAGRLEALVERLIYNVLVKLANPICSYYSVELEEWHEKLAFAKGMLLRDFIDENSLYVLALLVTHDGNTKYIYDIDLAGCIVGELNIKTAHLITQGGWFNYLFKPKFTEFLKQVRDDQITKPKIFSDFIETVSTDVKFVSMEKETYKLKPSQLYNGSIQVDVGLEGRHIEIVNNSFDEPVIRTNRRLVNNGVLKNAEQYAKVVNAFDRHWRLPYGSIEFEGVELNTLPLLLIAFTVLNMYTDGVTNQRHSAFVITAPSGIGKTSLIKNIAEAGLSNDDEHAASVFGYKGLYPKSVDSMKNKLWATGDELSPAAFKEILTPILLSNLTRLEVGVNVKGQIDNSFTTFGKVLWGARAWEGISMGDQATELRNRLFAITYTEEHFEQNSNFTTDFLEICEEDTGYVDNIIQHRLGDMYLQFKQWVLSIDMDTRIKLLNKLKVKIKKKYAGTMYYENEYDENGRIKQATVKKVASDNERILAQVLEILITYRTGLITEPNPLSGKSIVFNVVSPPKGSMEQLDSRTRRMLLTEEINYTLYSQGTNLMVVPNANSNTVSWYHDIIDKVLGAGSNKAFYLKNHLKVNILHKFLSNDGLTGYPNSQPSEFVDMLSNRNTRYITGYSKVSARGMTFKVLSLDSLETYVSDNL